jgi:hypothetical protein
MIAIGSKVEIILLPHRPPPIIGLLVLPLSRRLFLFIAAA